MNKKQKGSKRAARAKAKAKSADKREKTAAALKEEVAEQTLALAERAAAASVARAEAKASVEKKMHNRGPNVWTFACKVAKESLMNCDGFLAQELRTRSDRQSLIYSCAKEALEEWRLEAIAKAKHDRAHMQKAKQDQPSKKAKKVATTLQEAVVVAKSSTSDTDISDSSDFDSSTSDTESSSDSESSCRYDVELPPRIRASA